MVRRILFGVIALACTLLVMYIIGTAVGFQDIWARMAGSPDMGPVNFSGFEKGPKPNQALVCPAGLCDAGSVDIESPVYALDALRLIAQVEKSVDAMDSQRVDKALTSTIRRYVIRSKRLRFADTLSIETIEGATAGTSQIAIYSVSQMGYSDMGVNLARVQGLLDSLSVHQKR